MSATRRGKLRNIFAVAAERGLTAQDLLDDIESFSANGGSGIESYLDSALASLSTTEAAPCSDLAEAVKAAVAILSDAV